MLSKKRERDSVSDCAEKSSGGRPSSPHEIRDLVQAEVQKQTADYKERMEAAEEQVRLLQDEHAWWKQKRDNERYTRNLFESFLDEDWDEVCDLLEDPSKLDIHYVDDIGMNMLHYAARCNRHEYIETIVASTRLWQTTRPTG